ncbi:Hypothetical predicted protein, partial [Xyrichtys novacula]
MSRCSQVVQGLIKAFMIHAAPTIPTAPIDKTPPRSAFNWLVALSENSEGNQDELPSRSDLCLRFTVCHKSCSMSTEREAEESGVQKAISGTAML